MSKPVSVVLTFLVGSLFFILLPFIGWGLDNISRFFLNPARTGFIVFVILLNGYASIRNPEVGKKKNKGKKKVERQHLALILLQVLSIALVLTAPFCDKRKILIISSSDILRFIGLAFYIVGFITMHLVERHLGKQFSVEVVIQKNHKLVTDGLFRYIRHPRYLGIIIFATGIALIFNSWSGLFLILLIIIVLLWRINDEEKLMQNEFGERWAAYKEGTDRLIPFIF
jgi:protein-S-isoprenylcysteine O-methyltransferase Ste14